MMKNKYILLSVLLAVGIVACPSTTIKNAPPSVGVNLPAENCYQLYLFCKEAINNAVKYSEAGLVALTIKENDNLLDITICDDGKGFDAQTIKRGNGLNNMHKRANELGADFSIQSKTGEGCMVSLKLKITQ